jgi:hypothetical protein
MSNPTDPLHPARGGDPHPSTRWMVESGKNILSVKEERGGLRYTQQPLYNFLEDKNILCYSYPDDGRGDTTFRTEYCLSVLHGLDAPASLVRGAGGGGHAQQKYTIYLARGKGIPGRLDRGPPPRDLPVHDPGWHRTGNFPMLTGMSRPMDPLHHARGGDPHPSTRWMVESGKNILSFKGGSEVHTATSVQFLGR